MSKNSKRAAREQVAATPEQVAATTEQVAATPEQVVAAEPAKKKARYAPTSAIDNPKAIIRLVGGPGHNPKRNPSKSYDRWAQFHQDGQTVEAFVGKYVAANRSKMAARNDLRWELAHGLITLELPTAE